MLKNVFQTTGDLFFSCRILELRNGSLCHERDRAGDKVLVEFSGMFGHRFKEIVEAQGGKVVPLSVESGNAVDPDDARKVLERDGKIKAMTLVHSEISTA